MLRPTLASHTLNEHATPARHHTRKQQGALVSKTKMRLGQRSGTRLELAEALAGLGDDGLSDAKGTHLLGDGAAWAAPSDDDILHDVAVDTELLAPVGFGRNQCTANVSETVKHQKRQHTEPPQCPLHAAGNLHLAAVHDARADGAAPSSEAAVQEGALATELVLLLANRHALAAPVLDEHGDGCHAGAEVQQVLALEVIALREERHGDGKEGRKKEVQMDLEGMQRR